MRVLPHTGIRRRVGITGVPGVGKSTFIEALGMHLIRDRGEKVAVLSVDPSSPVSRRQHPRRQDADGETVPWNESAFIRPSPSRGQLGGVARRTRETMLLCEAAGYRNVIVETVGVGQSETAVRSMMDFFLLLMLAGAGDELQGMKRGIMEMIDGMAINKADGDNKAKAERARVEYASALHLFPASARRMDAARAHLLVRDAAKDRGSVGDGAGAPAAPGSRTAISTARRSKQALDWMNEMIALGLEDTVPRASVRSLRRLPELKQAVADGTITSFAAARELLAIFHSTRKSRLHVIFSFPVLTADEAAALIQNGQTVGFSGFTPAGAPKAIPLALASTVRSGARRRPRISESAF